VTLLQGDGVLIAGLLLFLLLNSAKPTPFIEKEYEEIS
jgi:hypothetical protein